MTPSDDYPIGEIAVTEDTELQREIQRAVEKVLDRRSRLDAEIHADHHRWVAAQIEREQARTEMYRKVAETVASWAVVALIGAALAYFGIRVGDR